MASSKPITNWHTFLSPGIGGLAVIGIGRIGDIWGLSTAVFVIFILPILAGIIALGMKSRPAARMERKAG